MKSQRFVSAVQVTQALSTPVVVPCAPGEGVPWTVCDGIYDLYVLYFPFTLEGQCHKLATFQWLPCMIRCFLYHFQSVTSRVSHGAMMKSMVNDRNAFVWLVVRILETLITSSKHPGLGWNDNSCSIY